MEKLLKKYDLDYLGRCLMVVFGILSVVAMVCFLVSLKPEFTTVSTVLWFIGLCVSLGGLIFGVCCYARKAEPENDILACTLRANELVESAFKEMGRSCMSDDYFKDVIKAATKLEQTSGALLKKYEKSLPD